MHTRNPLRRASRVAALFLVSMILISLWTVVGAQVSASVTQTAAADVTGQLSDNQLTSGDLGVAPNFVSANTVVRTPGGELAGPEGVQAFIESLQLDYPDAQFEVTEFQNVGNLIIVDWQGTVDGVVAIPGRTLIVVQDGVIEQLSFLNLNNVSPVEGGPRFAPSEPGRAAFVDYPVLTGSGYEGHVAEAELNQARSDLDSNASAERIAQTPPVVDPAHPCIPCDIS